jgi:hypothetical protein
VRGRGTAHAGRPAGGPPGEIEAEQVADDVADVLAQLPPSLPADRLESRIVMELAIRFQDDRAGNGHGYDPLHPGLRGAIARVEDCFCRYREELVEGETPARARAFWVTAALRVLHRATGPAGVRALLHAPSPDGTVSKPRTRSRNRG